jgi:hypothetical protein
LEVVEVDVDSVLTLAAVVSLIPGLVWVVNSVGATVGPLGVVSATETDDEEVVTVVTGVSELDPGGVTGPIDPPPDPERFHSIINDWKWILSVYLPVVELSPGVVAQQGGVGLTQAGWLQTDKDSSKMVPSAQMNSKSVNLDSVP